MLTKAQAIAAGKKRGLSAASWVFDGNTSERTLRDFLKALDDGDDTDQWAPPQWLSGEWAGESVNEILGEAKTARQQEKRDEIASEYEAAADEAYWHELERFARANS